jgi:hypothetical protein
MNRITDNLRSFFDRWGSVYLMVIVASVAIDALREEVPAWPLSYYTLIWTLSLFFPAIASLYILFNLRVRLDQIEDSAQRNSVFSVYFPGSQAPERDFSRLLSLRFRSSCNAWELGVFSLSATIITFMVLYFPYYEVVGRGADPDLSSLPTSVWLIWSGFFGAFSGSLVLILKKYRTLDIYPSTYFQTTIAIILGPLIGAFVAGGFTPTSGQAPGTSYSTMVVTTTTFALGFITATNVNFLGGLFRRRIASVTGTTLPEAKEGDLKDLIDNSEAIESLNAISCYSIAELLSTEPMILYLNMPQSISCVDMWLDSALLAHYFCAQKERLKSSDITRFTQLIEYVVEDFPPPDSNPTAKDFIWRQEVTITGEEGTDRTIANALKAILASELHHRLLGILSTRYRKTFFANAKMKSA